MAAGHSVGMLYVELDLDASRYMKAQQNILKEAQFGASVLEKNFKNLGIKSGAAYDLMRSQAIKSFEQIKNSSKVTADDIVRAERAKNEQLKRLNDQQFGSQKSLLQGLKDNWLVTTGAIVSAWYTVKKAVDAVKDIALVAARYETLGVAMEVVGRNAGYGAEEMAKFQKGLEETGISMIGARQSLTRMAQAQLDLAYSSKLARGAQDAAVIGNMNSTEAFNTMVYGIQSANVRVLRTIGINVSWEQSYKKLAKQLGRTTTSFTEQEKASIRLNAVLEAVERITGLYSGAMETAGKKLLSLERHVENFKVTVGTGLLPVLGELVDKTTEWFKTNGEILAQDMAGWIKGTVEMLKWGIWPLQKWAEIWQVIGWISSGNKGMMPKYMPKEPEKPPKEPGKMPKEPGKMPSGKTGYLDVTAKDLSEITKLEEEFQLAKMDRTALEIELESGRYQTLRDMEMEHRQSEMDALVSSQEYKLAANQDYHNQAIELLKDTNAQEMQFAIEQQSKIAALEASSASARLSIMNSLGAAMISSSGASGKKLFLLQQSFQVGMAIMSAYLASNLARASFPGPPWTEPLAQATLAQGLWNAAAIAATGIASFAASGTGSTGGGTAISPTITSSSPVASLPETTQEEQRGTVNIYVQGDILGNKESMEYLAESLSEYVEKYDVRLVASHARKAEALA